MPEALGLACRCLIGVYDAGICVAGAHAWRASVTVSGVHKGDQRRACVRAHRATLRLVKGELRAVYHYVNSVVP